MRINTLIKSIIVLSLSFSLCAPCALAGKKEKKNDGGAKKTFRVLYWNIQNGMWDGQGDNYDRFVAWVNEKDPDICIFCEASTIFYTGTAKSMPKDERYLPAGWEELSARYGHKYVFRSAQRDNYPQVVTSKFPIDSIAGFIGHKPDSVIVHAAGWCQVQVPGLSQPLNIVTLHPKPGAGGYHVPKEKRAEDEANMGGERHRRMEVTYICNHTILKQKNPETQYWIMAGDYNSISRKDNFKYKFLDSSLSFLTQDYINGSTPYYDLVAETYPNMFFPSCGGRRIDFFYVTKPLINACKDINPNTDKYTQRWKDNPQISNFWHPSDHYPIVADFTISKFK